ncbi:MAG: hypothetical protein VZQ75_07280 [Candidatus Faecousia sp.]|nr:hypothetical protein [Candidatus Faecousia sp.]
MLSNKISVINARFLCQGILTNEQSGVRMRIQLEQTNCKASEEAVSLIVQLAEAKFMSGKEPRNGLFDCFIDRNGGRAARRLRDRLEEIKREETQWNVIRIFLKSVN